MRKVSKILSALFILSLPIMVSPSKNVKADTNWEWATLRSVQGIAVCDGPSDNCTKPVRPKPQM